MNDSIVARAHKRGRPSKGTRAILRGRIDYMPPLEVAAQLRQSAARHNLSMSAMLTDLVVGAYGSRVDNGDPGAIPARSFETYNEWLDSLTPPQVERVAYVVGELGFKDAKAFWWQCHPRLSL